jgi:hypothetical protein
MTDKLSRRDLLQQGAALGALALGAAAVGACNKSAPALACTDTAGLAPTDVQIRTTLAYVDASTEPGKTCANCQQFVAPPTAGACGTCKVLKGPINPAGNCKSFVAKPA